MLQRYVFVVTTRLFPSICLNLFTHRRIRSPTFLFHFRIRSRGIGILQLHDVTVDDVRVAGFVRLE